MTDDTMAQDSFEPGADLDTPATETDPLAALTTENAELKDRLLRLAADMENLRKRMAREIEDTRTSAITKFARDLLTAPDSAQSSRSSRRATRSATGCCVLRWSASPRAAPALPWAKRISTRTPEERLPHPAPHRPFREMAAGAARRRPGEACLTRRL